MIVVEMGESGGFSMKFGVNEVVIEGKVVLNGIYVAEIGLIPNCFLI